MPWRATIGSIVAGALAYAGGLVVLYFAQCEAFYPQCPGTMYDVRIVINLLLLGLMIGVVCGVVIAALGYSSRIGPYLLQRPSLIAAFAVLGSLPFAYMCTHWSCRPGIFVQEVVKGVIAGLLGGLGFVLMRRLASNRAVQRTPTSGRR
jgi:hypothetical protein